MSKPIEMECRGVVYELESGKCAAIEFKAVVDGYYYKMILYPNARVRTEYQEHLTWSGSPVTSSYIVPCEVFKANEKEFLNNKYPNK